MTFSDKKTIFLIGPMGAGKTTIGRRLAKVLSRDFYDSDHEIEGHTGVDIPFIFEKEGETGFRKREAETIAELAEKRSAVIATGGGAVTTAENRQTMATKGFVIYLKTSVEQQYQRTAKSTHRPLLQTANPKQKLQQLFEQRHPLYAGAADLVVETDGQQASSVCQKILDQLS